MSGDVWLVCLSFVVLCESSYCLSECSPLYCEEGGFHSVVNKAYNEMKDKTLNGSPCSFSKELFTDYQVIVDQGLTVVVDNLPSHVPAQSIFHHLSSTLSVGSGYIEIRFTKQGRLIRAYLKMPSPQKLNSVVRRSEKLRMGNTPLLLYPYYSPPLVSLRTVGTTYCCRIYGLPRSWSNQAVEDFLHTMTPLLNVKRVGEEWEFYTSGLRLLRSCFPTRDDVFPNEKKSKIAWWRLLEAEYAMEPKPEELPPERRPYVPDAMEPTSLSGVRGRYPGRGDPRQAMGGEFAYPGMVDDRYGPQGAGDSCWRLIPRRSSGRGEFAQEGGEARGVNPMIGRREQMDVPASSMRERGRGRAMGPYANQGMSQGMGQGMGQFANQPMNQYAGQPMGQYVTQPMNQYVSQPMSQYTGQPMSQPMNQYVGQPVSQPVSQPMNQFNPYSNQFSQPTSQATKQFSQFANQPATKPTNAYSYEQPARITQTNQLYPPLESSPAGVLLEGFIHEFSQSAVIRLLRSFGTVDKVRFVDATTSYALSSSLTQRCVL